MEFEDIMLSEIDQSQKDNYMLSLICGRKVELKEVEIRIVIVWMLNVLQRPMC
jgi:hypothetical protein